MKGQGRGDMMRDRRMQHRWIALLGLCLALSGCGPKAKPPIATPPPSPARVEEAAAPEADQSAVTLRLLAEELNSARLAANKVATMPGVSDPRARQEIALQASMYRAAYDSRVSKTTGHFVLDPVKEDHPPDIGVDPEEFRLRVLGSLDDLGVPIAWVTETWRSTGVDHFPGLGEPGPVATRLRITITQRDEHAGIVLGEVGDWTAGGGASKQGVTCRWDGLTWQIERDSVRMTW